MARTIYKYAVPIADYPIITLPRGAEVLHFGVQAGQPFIWALVDPDERVGEDRCFRLAGTGHPLDDGKRKRYVGTIQLRNGSLVLHLFET